MAQFGCPVKMTTPEVSLVLSERLVECLVVDNFRFTKQNVLKCGRTKWRCERGRRSKCQAKCYTEGERLVLVEHELLHNHEPDVKKYTRQAISNSSKRKAEEDLYSKPCKIIRSEISCSRNKETLSERDINKIRQNIRNRRNKTLPPLTESIEEIQNQLDEMCLLTDQEEPYLLENDLENKIVIFGCKNNIDELKTAASIMVDGTFDFCCKYFKQLLIVFVVKNGHYIPVMFCLLPDKKESTYKCLFGKVKIMTGNDNLEEITADFEIAIHNALKITWPSADIF